MSDHENEILKESRRIHESAMLSAQNQFEFSKRWRRADRWVGGASAVLAGVSGVGGLAELLTRAEAGGVAVAAAVAAAIAASLDAPRSKERAHVAANAYLSLQQDVRIFMNVDFHSLTETEARQRLDDLVARQQQLNAEAEIPSAVARRKAAKVVKKGGQQYEVDE